MKIIAAPLTVVIVLFLSCVTLMGQKSLLLQDVKPLIAVVTDANNDVELSEENSSSSFQLSLEDRLEAENWMISTEQWEMDENDAELDVEEWMVQPFRMADIKLSELVKEDLESPLKLEKWMYCCADWKIVRL
ncbi:MAG: hypothetical protein KAT15_26290 [Bacteroidales bacterium]|nr:hypothetical protein [Bacteroidales bacterium]